MWMYSFTGKDGEHQPDAQPGLMETVFSQRPGMRSKKRAVPVP